MDNVIGYFIFLFSFSSVVSNQGDISLCQYSDNNRLDCRGTGLTSIPNSFPIDVLTIDLTRNKIVEINKDAFANLTQLEMIILSINNINVIRTRSFSSLPNLKKVMLDFNTITLNSIEVNAFCYLPSLLELVADHNHVLDIEYLGTTFQQMPNIRKLKFDTYDEFRFRNLYKNLPLVDDIEMIIPRCCYFLRNDTFCCNESAGIRKLSVELTDIELGSFCHLKNIEELSLYIYLHSKAFNAIFKSLGCLRNHHLNKLEIKGNSEPTVLGEDQLRPLSNLCITRIFLTRNSIADVNILAFEYFARRANCLQELDLSNNPFAVGGLNWVSIFSMFTNLKTINLANLRDDDLSNTCSISNCDYHEERNIILPNTIQAFSVTDYNLGWHLSVFNFSHGINLMILDLSNLIVCSCDIVFHGIPNLKYFDTSGWVFLSVRHNFLQSIPNLITYICENSFLGRGIKNNPNIKDFFKNSKHLQYINLHGNQLQDLPSVFFDPVLNSLKFLNLSMNNLIEIPLATHKFPKLDVIDLRHNQIKEISLEDRISISEATHVKVYLSGNPFRCVCNTLQFLLWKNISFIEDYNKLVCTTEKGKSIFIADFLKSIDAFEQHCIDKQWIILGSSLASLIALVILIGTVIYKYRHTIQYWNLIRFKRMCNNTSTLDTMPYLYHAFLAYSQKDYDEVLAIMKILRHENFNIAMDHITFIPGVPIAENIINAIDNSRKIIFFVTQNFLESSWGSFEIEMARTTAYRDARKDMIILVIKENIPKETLPSALKHIWRRVTCIEWPETVNQARQRLFHQQLIRSIRF